MSLEIITFNSELEFREYVIQHSKGIERLLVFEDTLDQMIFFYCFAKSGSYVATKEHLFENFNAFKHIYTQLANKLELNNTTNYNNNDTIEFISKEA